MALQQVFTILSGNTKRSMMETFTLLSVSRLAEHVTHDVMFGGLAVPQTMHSNLSESRTLACGTFCGPSGASHIKHFGALRGTIPLQFTHGPTYHISELSVINHVHLFIENYQETPIYLGCIQCI